MSPLPLAAVVATSFSHGTHFWNAATVSLSLSFVVVGNQQRTESLLEFLSYLFALLKYLLDIKYPGLVHPPTYRQDMDTLCRWNFDVLSKNKCPCDTLTYRTRIQDMMCNVLRVVACRDIMLIHPHNTFLDNNSAKPVQQGNKKS